MRYYGKIGYFDTVETKPGLVENQMIYKTLYPLFYFQ